MSNNQISFVKTDNNIIINEQHIIWVKKMNECLEVCTKSNGCGVYTGEIHKICKINNLHSYNKLNEHFKQI